MATDTFEAIFSLSAAAPKREQKVRNVDIGRVSDVTPAIITLPERRREARIDYRCMCSYALLEPLKGKFAVIEQGEAFALNRSTEGILLIMGQAPHSKQLIELHTPGFGRDRSETVVETRWVKTIQVESLGSLFLVGSQRVFGSCQYLSC